jgi:hypothetical protein
MNQKAFIQGYKEAAFKPKLKSSLGQVGSSLRGLGREFKEYGRAFKKDPKGILKETLWDHPAKKAIVTGSGLASAGILGNEMVKNAPAVWDWVKDKYEHVKQHREGKAAIEVPAPLNLSRHSWPIASPEVMRNNPKLRQAFLAALQERYQAHKDKGYSPYLHNFEPYSGRPFGDLQGTPEDYVKALSEGDGYESLGVMEHAYNPPAKNQMQQYWDVIKDRYGRPYGQEIDSAYEDRERIRKEWQTSPAWEEYLKQFYSHYPDEWEYGDDRSLKPFELRVQNYLKSLKR